ncbi:MAG: UDP-galactopyranose mutase [Bdellovibrionota bacterium]|nr:UDP-galactopyranose mutase [Bdellovibrionota bacterium]
MKKETDYLIVGSGFFGSVLAERISRVLKKRVTILEKRNHIGGNCYSHRDEETGIEYHKYGTHIFHTNSKEVLQYLSQFTELNGYYHQVLTTHKNRVYQMPINLETINAFFGVNLRPFEVKDFLSQKIPKGLDNPKNLEEKAISQIGPELYNAFIKGYTTKQWQKDPKDLPASIINRLPIRSSYNESYFNNGRYQGIPLEGFTAIFEKMLDHELIEVHLEKDFFKERENYEVLEKTIYTGPIDRYFEYCFGKLDWRSVRFEHEVKDVEDYQGTSVMNYADLEAPYTRIHEPKHLHPERKSTQKTLIIKEYSHDDEQAPYYPINDEKNKELYRQYAQKAKQEKDVLFGGRLGTYSYYDMDQVIAQALTQFQKLS